MSVIELAQTDSDRSVCTRLKKANALHIVEPKLKAILVSNIMLTVFLAKKNTFLTLV